MFSPEKQGPAGHWRQNGPGGEEVMLGSFLTGQPELRNISTVDTGTVRGLPNLGPHEHKFWLKAVAPRN
jgi:hypothetical protein